MSTVGLYGLSLIGLVIQQYIMLKLFCCILKPRYDGRLIVFLLQFVMSFIYCGLLLHNHLQTHWFLWIYLFAAILVDLYIIQVIGELEVRQESKEKLEFEQQREENVRIYYQNLVLKLKNVSELKEEYEKKLKNIYDELGVEYQVETGSAESAATELEDVHPEGKLKESYISGRTYAEGDFFVIELTNIKSPNGKLVQEDGNYLSSKKEKEGHGYGLQIIGRIAGKYNGKMELAETEEYFTNKVMMKIK